jgi:hypothetical protein
MRNGAALPGVEPGTLFRAWRICDSSPWLSEVTHLYDILNFSKNNFCDLTQIRTEIPSQAVWL